MNKLCNEYEPCWAILFCVRSLPFLCTLKYINESTSSIRVLYIKSKFVWQPFSKIITFVLLILRRRSHTLLTLYSSKSFNIDLRDFESSANITASSAKSNKINCISSIFNNPLTSVLILLTIPFKMKRHEILLARSPNLTPMFEETKFELTDLYPINDLTVKLGLYSLYIFCTNISVN